MRDLAPDITRQRLLIEGLYDREITRGDVETYLVDVAAHLGLRTYGKPIVHDPGGEGQTGNQGFDAFIPLIDSGISLYVWSQKRFFAVVVFTCKKFDEKNALDFTQRFFAATEVEHREF